MSSTNYWISWDTVNSGGDDVGTSTNFSIYDSIGGNVVGTGTSANYTLSQGYRVPEEANTLSYIVKANSSVTTTYSAFTNGVGGTISVGSTNGFAAGNLIAVVENRGFGQLVAVGFISAISGTTITIDRFEGDGASMSALPTGGNDFVSLLNVNSFDFGSVYAGTEYTSTVGTSILTNVSTGYSVYIQGNQYLQKTNLQVMAPVTDGTVSVGFEEYGAEVTGTTAFGAGTDRGVTTTQRVIQTSASASGTVSDKVAMIFKLSIAASTVPGTYTQTVYYTLTANY
ncbi:MAG: hypothetical protein AAB668_04710 [Patescibacteria group bacterium]